MERSRGRDGRDRDDLPLHWERAALGATPRLAGWLVGLLGCCGGVAVMVLAPDSPLEALGAAAAALGVVALVAVVRCAQLEVTLGRRWLKLACGPWRHDLPLHLVEATQVRAASSWRRLYAEQEVVVGLVGGTEVAVASRDPDELVRLLSGGDGLRAGV